MKKNNDIVYRKASVKDLNKICCLRKQLADDPEDKKTSEYAPYSPERDRYWIQKCLQSRNKIVLIAELNEIIIAHAIILIEKVPSKMQQYYTYKKKALLVHLYVDRNNRRKGIATHLINYALKYLKELAVEFVDLECYTYNQKANYLYDKIGFQDVFTTKRFKL